VRVWTGFIWFRMRITGLHRVREIFRLAEERKGFSRGILFFEISYSVRLCTFIVFVNSNIRSLCFSGIPAADNVRQRKIFTCKEWRSNPHWIQPVSKGLYNYTSNFASLSCFVKCCRSCHGTLNAKLLSELQLNVVLIQSLEHCLLVGQTTETKLVLWNDDCQLVLY